MMSLKNISKSFGYQVVLKNVSLTVFENECTTLVGPNGSGKTTLLKILAGILQPDEGKVEIFNNSQIVYFPQELSLENQKKTGKELLSKEMGLALEKVLGEIGVIFKKLRFPPEKLEFHVENLSGGEKSKLLLMLILSSRANIFLLDEPTNNLDLRGLVILENFIRTSSRSFLIVSHDRKFLERVVAGIIEINNETHNLEIYSPYTYDAYLKEKRRKEKQELRAYQDYTEEKKRLEEVARRKKEEAKKMQRGPKIPRDKDKYILGFKKDRSKKLTAQSRAVDKRLERLDKVEKPKYHLPLNLKFQFSERSGDVVLRAIGAEVEYNKFHLGPIDLEVNYGDRIVILGPNGEGKTTFLRLLVGKQQTTRGFIHTGTRVKIGYLPQEMIFQEQQNILQYFFQWTDFDETSARRILARFGFSADDMKISVDKLSPGERSRLILATLMAKDVNCLILDEPTNHLDPEALDRLEEALKDFTGTIIIVSHDRYLIDRIGITKTYLMENGKLAIIKDYHNYENKVLSEK